MQVCYCAGHPSTSRTSHQALIQSTPSPSAVQQPSEPADLANFEVSGSITDAGLMLGRSCRVGWGPNGTLVIPGMPNTQINPQSPKGSTVCLAYKKESKQAKVLVEL